MSTELDEYIKNRSIENQRNKLDLYGRHKRLKRAMLSRWEELLAIRQSSVPGEVNKILRDFPQVAIITLWMSPNPSIKAYRETLVEDVGDFVNNGQSNIWEGRARKKVINYFKSIASDRHPLRSVRVPSDVKLIAATGLNDSATAVLWKIPSPWLWGDGRDNRDYFLDSRRSPCEMYKDGFTEQVLDYFSVLADNFAVRESIFTS